MNVDLRIPEASLRWGILTAAMLLAGWSLGYPGCLVLLVPAAIGGVIAVFRIAPWARPGEAKRESEREPPRVSELTGEDGPRGGSAAGRRGAVAGLFRRFGTRR
jgi:hypothetical protein